MREKERFSAPEKSCSLILRFSAGDRKARAKAHCEIERFSAGLKSSFPLLKQGAPTKTFPTKTLSPTFSAAFELFRLEIFRNRAQWRVVTLP